MAKKKQKRKTNTIKEELVKLSVPGELLRGQYTNFATIRHTANEFVLDFFLKFTKDDFSLVSRILTSPDHVLLLLEALKRNIKKYEKKFGPIKKRRKGEQK